MGKDNEYFIKAEIYFDEEKQKHFQRQVKVKKLLKWKVVNGYGASDFFIIGEDDLEKVKYAWATKGIYKLKYSGAEIKKIVPHYSYYTGWNENYEPKTAEEISEAKRSTPLHLMDERERVADARLRYIVENNKPLLLDNLQVVDLQLPEADRPQKEIEQSREIKKLTSNLAEKFTNK